MAPIPGKYRMVNAVSSPDRTSQGTGHQAGAGLEKIWFGSSENGNFWIAATSARKRYAIAEIGIPQSPQVRALRYMAWIG